MLFDLFRRRAHHADAKSALARGDFDGAVAHMRRELARDPEHAATWLRRIGETLALAGDRPAALSALWDAARRLEDQGRMLEAVAVYQGVLRIDPDDETLAERIDEMAADGATAAERGLPTSGPASMSPFLRRRAPLFCDLARDELRAMLEVVAVSRVETGRTLFRRGEPSDRLFLVARGEVALTTCSAEGLAVERCRVSEGEPFGEVSRDTLSPCEWSALAARSSELIELSREAVDIVARSHPRVWPVVLRFQQEHAPIVTT